MEIESAPSGGVLKKEIDVQSLKFKPEAIQETYKSLFNESYCQVCFGFHDLANSRSVPIAEKGLEMMICYGCRIHVHRYCYGYKTLTNEILIKKEERSQEKIKISMFVCDRCKNLDHKAKKGCKICHQPHGAMKKVAGNEYVHIICALFSDTYEVVDFQSMTIGVANKSQNEPEDDDATCQYCRKSGGLFKCEKCDEHTHVYCAFAERTPFLLKDEDSQKGWRIVIDENQTPTEKTVNLSSAKTPKFSQKIRSQEEKKDISIESSSQIMGLDSIKQEEERHKKIWESLDKNLKKEIPGFPLVTYSKKTFLKLQCQGDRDPEVFCYCLRPYSPKPKNFGCESCSKRIEYLSSHLTYKGSSIPPTIKTLDKVGVIMESRMKFKVLDYVIASLILQRKLFESLKKGQNLEEVLESLKDAAQYIPFNLDGIFGKVLAVYKMHQLNKTLKAEENEEENIIKQWVQEKIKVFETERTNLLQQEEQQQELTLEEAFSRLETVEALCKAVVVDLRPGIEEIGQLINPSNNLLQKEHDEVKKIQENWDGEDFDFQQKREIAETMMIGFPEVESFIKFLREIKETELKLEWYACFEEYLVQNNSPNKTEYQSLVSFTEDDLKNILKRAKKIHPVENEHYQKVANILRFIQNFKKEAIQSIEKAIDIPTLKKLHHQAEKFENGFTEADAIKSKYTKFNQIKDILKNTKSYKFSQLEERFEEFENNFIDERWRLSFSQKIQSANQVKFQVKKFFDQEIFGGSNFLKKLDEILMKVERCQVHLEEKEDLISLQKSFQWLKRLQVFLKKCLDVMETEEDIEKMCEFCNQTSLTTEEASKETLVNYKALIDEGKEIMHIDKRIKEVFDFHEKMCWNLRVAYGIMERSIAVEDLKQLYKEGLDMNGINQRDFRKIESLLAEYTNWAEKYKNFIESEDFESMFESGRENDVKGILLQLEEECEKLGVKAQDEHRVIKSALSWIAWSEKASDLLEMVSSKKKISLKGLEDLVSFGVLIKIPESFHLTKKVTELYNKLRELQISFQSIIQKCQETKTRREKAQKIMNEDVRTTELDKLYDACPLLQKAFEVQKRVSESSLSVEEEDLEELGKNIRLCQAWGNRVKFFLELHTKDGGKVTDSKKIQEVNHGLKSIRNEMSNTLFLRDTKWEKELFRYYWQLNVNSITNKLSSKIFSYSYDSWRTLYNAAQKSGNEGILSSDLYKEIESQVEKFGVSIEKVHRVQYDDEILQKEQQIRDNQELITRQELLQLKAGLEGCKINIKKEKEYLDGLIEKLTEIIGPYLGPETLGRLKVPTKQYSEVLNQLLELPVQPEIEPFDVSWQKSKEIESLLGEVNNRGGTLVPLELAEKVYSQYRDCCIRIPEAQKISKLYSENIVVFKSLQENVEKTKHLFEDIQDLNRKADHLKLDFGPRLEEIKISLWITKVDLLKQFKEAKALPKSPIRLSTIRECLLEGYNYMKTRESIRKLRPSVQFMEQLLSEVNRDEEGAILFNFIDIRENILNSFESEEQEHLIQNFGVKDEDEILEIKNTLFLDQGKNIARKGQPQKAAAAASLLKKRSSTFEPIDDFPFPSKEPTKVIKRESAQVTKVVDEENEGQVDDAIRLESRKQLFRAMKDIPDLERKTLVVDLENHSFQKFQNRPDIYEKRIKNMSVLFEKLKKCKYLMPKLLKSQFGVKEVLTLMKDGVEAQEQIAQEEVLSHKSILDSLYEAKGTFDSPFSAKHLQAKKATPPEEILTSSAIKKKRATENSFGGGGGDMEEEKEIMAIQRLFSGTEKRQEEAHKGEKDHQIKKIWNGEIRFQKKNFQNFRCSVYTCEKNDLITKFPKFDGNLDFLGRIKLKEGLEYLKSLIGKPQKKVFLGWIYVEDEFQGVLQTFMNGLLADEKIGSVKCNSQHDSMMYLIPVKSVPEELKSKSDWHSRNAEIHPHSKEIMLCAIYYKGQLPDNFECIRPQIVKRIASRTSSKSKSFEFDETPSEPREDKEITSSLSIKNLPKNKLAHLLRGNQGQATPRTLSQQDSVGSSSQKKSKDQSPHQSKKERSRLL